MSTLGRTRIRLAGDAARFDGPFEVRCRATPQFWRGNDLQFEIGAYHDGALQSVANIASITVEIKSLGTGGCAPAPEAAVLMSKTVAAEALDDSLTQETWEDGTKQHALISFTAGESNIAPGPKWLAVWVLTNDSPGRVITLTAGPIRVLEDGAGLSTAPTPPEEIFYTAAQADSRFLAIADVEDQADARERLGLGTAAVKDAPASGNASSTQVVLGNDTRLSNNASATHAATHASGGSDAVTLAQSQITNLTTDLAAKAPLASPGFTGTPTAPTPAALDASTKIATTEFVHGEMTPRLNNLLLGREGLLLDGTGFLILPDSLAALRTSQYSFGLWASFRNPPGKNSWTGTNVELFGGAIPPEIVLQRWEISGNQRAEQLRRNAGGYLEYEISGDGSATYKATATNHPLTASYTDGAGQFAAYRVDVVVDLAASSNKIKLYVNNQACTVTTTGTAPASLYASSAHLMLGAPANGLDGCVSSLAFDGYPLTPAQIAARSKGAEPDLPFRFAPDFSGAVQLSGSAQLGNNNSGLLIEGRAWTAYNAAVSKEDGIGPSGDLRDACIKIRQLNSGAPAARQIILRNVFPPGKTSKGRTYRVDYEYFNPSANSEIGSLLLWLADHEHTVDKDQTKDEWLEKSVTVTMGTLANSITDDSAHLLVTVYGNADTDSYVDTNNTDAIYVRNIRITELGGAFFAAEDLQPAPGLWLDKTGHGHHALQGVKGTQVAGKRQGARFVFQWTRTATGFLGDSDRAVLPENYFIEAIVLETAGASTVQLGHSSGTAGAISGSSALEVTDGKCVLAGMYAATDQRLYLTRDAGTVTVWVKGFVL